MATLRPARSRSVRSEVESVHVLAEFVEENGSTAVVPLQRVLDLEDLDKIKSGDNISVLWYDGKKYPAVYLTSGTKKFCLSEEQEMIDENVESSGYDPSSEEDEEGGIQDESGGQEIDNSVEKQRSAVNKQDNSKGKKAEKNHKSKHSQSNSSRKANKENFNTSKINKNGYPSNDDDFIVRMGRMPMRSLPLNVTGIATHDSINKDEEIVRKDLESYTGQTVELYCSDDDDDEFYRCCARIERGFDQYSFGALNKSITIPVDSEATGARYDPPIHYTSGAQEMECSTLKGSVISLKSLVQANEENQRKVNKEIRSDITKINTKIDDANKSLSLILAQLIRPNSLHPDGYVTPPASITQPTGVAQFNSAPSSVVTASTSIVNSANITQYGSSVSSSPTVITTTSVLSAANATISTPASPVVTLSVNVVNPANVANSIPLSPTVSPSASDINPVVTQYANSVPSSPLVTPTSNVNPAVVTQYANSIPSSPIVTPTSNVNPAVVTQYANSIPSSPVVTPTSNVYPAIDTQYANSVPSSPVVTPTSNVNPAVVTQYANSVPSSPVVAPTSNVNPAVVTEYANSIPSSPVVPPTSNVNHAVVTQYVPSSPVARPSTISFANVIPSGPMPNIVNSEIITSSSPETQLPHRGILDSDQINFIRSGSCSRRNFAAKLVVELFDEATRKRCNVAGKLGKSKLNPVLIQYVKSLAFQFYPLEHHENEKAEWAKCIVSIDEINRRLHKSTKSAST